MSDELGRRVRLADGTPAGRLVDLTVQLGPVQPQVRRALVRGPRGAAHLIPCECLADGPDAPASGTLRRWRTDLHRPALRPDELLLRRDVLDTQVVDLVGHRLTRVGDVLLRRSEGTERRAGLGTVVVALELGTAPVLRRLGLRALARRTPAQLVGWDAVHLTSHRGHVIQLTSLDAAFRHLDARDLAELVARLSTSRARDLLGAIGAERAAAAIRHSHPHVARRLADVLEGEAHPPEPVVHPHAPVRRTLRRVHPTSRGRRYRRTAGWRLHRPPRA